jgi:alkanesulfonate monooxygenase SsuD/methylene tetrahydromethanopterin reductase-like flavin-dependent oxidoreductase (luciferase family)
MCLNINPNYLVTYWAAVCEGVAQGGRTPRRRDWRVVREVYVAETDTEARDKAVHGMLGQVYLDHLLQLFYAFNLTELFKYDPSLPNAVVTPEYLIEPDWLVGSPQTVMEKLRQMYSDIGGFGCLLVLNFDRASTRPGGHTHSAY